MELAILIVLAMHDESLAADQIAAKLDDPLDEVQATLRRLRDHGLVDVLAVGEPEGNVTVPASYWSLTDAGRREIALHDPTDELF